VIGASILSGDPSDYTMRPFAISGSCKEELVEDQEKLLQHASDTLIETQLANNRRLYCLASNGDSHCRVLYVASPSSPTSVCQANYILLFLHYCFSTLGAELMK
jgi:hypothetical protein